MSKWKWRRLLFIFLCILMVVVLVLVQSNLSRGAAAKVPPPEIATSVSFTQSQRDDVCLQTFHRQYPNTVYAGCVYGGEDDLIKLAVLFQEPYRPEIAWVAVMSQPGLFFRTGVGSGEAPVVFSEEAPLALEDDTLRFSCVDLKTQARVDYAVRYQEVWQTTGTVFPQFTVIGEEQP